jgi:hypothetical protein
MPGTQSERKKRPVRKEKVPLVDARGAHTVLPLYPGKMIRRSKGRILRDGSGAISPQPRWGRLLDCFTLASLQRSQHLPDHRQHQDHDRVMDGSFASAP